MYLKRNRCSMSPQGDEYFNDGNLEAAVERYTRAIECDASNSLFPVNRAEALLKQERLVINNEVLWQAIIYFLLFIDTTVTNTSSSCSFYSVIAVYCVPLSTMLTL